MQTKTKILIVALIGSAVIAVIVFVIAQNKNSANVATEQNSGQTSNGNGGVVNLPPLQTTTLRNLPAAHSDSSQPFAVNAPRSREPQQLVNTAPVRTPHSSAQDIIQQKVSQAVAEGLIPDKDGFYVTSIDPSGVNKYDASQYNYNLDPNSFASTYYPDFKSVSSYGQPAQPGTDGLLVDSQQSDAPTSVPLVPGVDAAFHTTTNQSPQVYQTYLTNLNTSLKQMNLIGQPQILTEFADSYSGDPNALQFYQNVNGTILSQLSTMQVPQDMLGLQQAYYAMYQKFGKLLSDTQAYYQGVNSGNQAASGYLGNVQHDVDSLQQTIGDAYDRATAATQIFQARGITMPAGFLPQQSSQ